MFEPKRLLALLAGLQRAVGRLALHALGGMERRAAQAALGLRAGREQHTNPLTVLSSVWAVSPDRTEDELRMCLSRPATGVVLLSRPEDELSIGFCVHCAGGAVRAQHAVERLR